MPKNTSNARFGQVLSEIWPQEVFRSQNSYGWAQTGPTRVQTEAGRAQMGPKVRKLWKVISHSRVVHIRRLRCFLASIGNVDFKKHLKRLIRPTFE